MAPNARDKFIRTGTHAHGWERQNRNWYQCAICGRWRPTPEGSKNLEHRRRVKTYGAAVAAKMNPETNVTVVLQSKHTARYLEAQDE